MNPSTQSACQQRAEVFAAVADAIRQVSPRARALNITPDSLLLEELALDSLDLVAVVLRLQDQFQVELDPDEIALMRLVEELGTSLANRLRAAA
jgi:acyl carrier protein